MIQPFVYDWRTVLPSRCNPAQGSHASLSDVPFDCWCGDVEKTLNAELIRALSSTAPTADCCEKARAKLGLCRSLSTSIASCRAKLGLCHRRLVLSTWRWRMIDDLDGSRPPAVVLNSGLEDYRLRCTSRPAVNLNSSVLKRMLVFRLGKTSAYVRSHGRRSSVHTCRSEIRRSSLLGT